MFEKANKGSSSLASQPYFPPCAHARVISGWGEGRISFLSKIIVVAYLQCLHSELGDDG